MVLPPVATALFKPDHDRPVHLPERIIRIVFPAAVAILYYISLFPVIGYDRWLLLGGLMLAYVIPPAGKETVIPLGIALGFPWWLMAFSIALLDIVAGVFMALNFSVALKIPFLGGWIKTFIGNGEQFFRKRPWLEHYYFIGVVLFVMFPLQGSGGIGATLVGRMIGLSPGRVILAISIGALTGCAIIALGAEVIRELILMNITLGITVTAGVIITLLGAYAFYRYRQKKTGD